MATVTSKLHALKVAIVDGLAARANIISAGVQVSGAFLGKDTAVESIQLTGPDHMDQDWAALGKLSRNENITLQGLIWIQKPGADETVIRSTRARAFELLAEVEDFLRADPGVAAVVKYSGLRATDITEGANPEGRVCQLDFEIGAFQRLQST